MEVPDEVGRALPVPENATSVRAWKFTNTFIAILNSGKNPLPGSGKSCINSNSRLVGGIAELMLDFSACIPKTWFGRSSK